jgi:glycosyltransferase involved in cell wall biosynthesis
MQRTTTVSASHPIFTVIVLAYNSRDRVDTALRSLQEQDIDGEFEVVLVDSGTDDCAAYVARQYPEVRIVHSPVRLWPGQARNQGLQAARGEFVAFLSDDTAAAPGWLSARLAVHRGGAQAVGGAITNGTPRSVIGTAGYLLEYSALLPCQAILEEQEIPHCISFHRGVFDLVGGYPEDTTTGEDTLFNGRCLAAGIRFAYAPDAQISHLNLTSYRAYLAHNWAHGRGLVECVEKHQLGSLTGPIEQPLSTAVHRALWRYPLDGWKVKHTRLRKNAPGWLPRFLALSPHIYAGLLATGGGALHQQIRIRAARRSSA